MANIDKAFDVELISLNDTVLIVQGSFDPSTIGYEAERGSLFLQTTPTIGKLFLKTGNQDTDWTEVRDVLSKVSSNDTTAGTISLIMGILGCASILPCIGPILALVFGYNSKGTAGEDMGKFGKVLGWIMICLYLILPIIYIILVFLVYGGSWLLGR